jgi:uncharacterized protein YjbI with pentapeptide repeats
MRCPRAVLCCLMPLLAHAPLAAQRAAPAAAAVDTLALVPFVFYGRGANSIEPGDTSAADTVTAYLRAALDSAGRFALVDPARLEAELKRSRTATDQCATIACRSAVARRLGARYLVTGQLSKTSNLIWFISSQLTDVGDGRRLLDEEYELKGQRFDEARLGARVLGRRIVAAVGRQTASAAPADTVLTLEEVRKRLAQATESQPPRFSGANLSGLDLSGLDFTRADLTRARLTGARLVRSNLFSADLTDAVLNGADLTGANLDGTTLRRANFHNANLEGASLFATIVEKADLSGANLSKVRLIGYLKSANLTGANLRDANVGADPGNQSMGVMRATFVGADLSNADLTSTNLFKADFSFATLAGARLAGANLSNADLINTDLTRADLTGADLTKANINGANFTGAVGIATIRGLDTARNRDKATFDAN